MCKSSVPEKISIREIGLDQRDFLNAERSPILGFVRASKSLQPRDDILPVILRELLFRGCVWNDNQLN